VEVDGLIVQVVLLQVAANPFHTFLADGLIAFGSK
jgi:hypothetical protein